MSNTGIHILNRNTEEIEGFYTNTAKQMMILNNIHTRNRDEHSETFDFTVPYKYIDDFHNQNRVLIPDVRKGEYREFVIKHKETSDKEVFIQCDGAWLDDLGRNSEPLPPVNMQNTTVDEAVTYALSITGYKKGEITWDGFIDFETTEYTRPYDLLMKIEDLTGLQFDVTIETSGNEITGRYVHMREADDLSEFTGKELVRGKDIITIKQRENTRELATALLVTSTDKNDKPLVTKVYDSEARDRWGNNGKYTWDIYNIEANTKSNMTIEKMQTIGKRELKKRINTVVEYEVQAIEIIDQLGTEANFGDRIRVRDVTYNPHFYLEATVKSVQRDIFDDSSKEFVLGAIKKYNEASLRRYFTSLRSELKTKMNDSIYNIESIVETNKIHTGTTPPENPTEGKLWYDNTISDAVVLREYKNGSWTNKTPDNVEAIGGLTKEKALYKTFHQSYLDLFIHYTNLNNQVNTLLSNQYLVDETVKNSLNTAFTNLKNSYTNMSNKDKAMTESTATMTKLSDLQLAIDDFRTKAHLLYNETLKADDAIEKRISLLQSQYSDQKYKEAMDKVASTLPNGKYDPTTNQLTADIPTQTTLNNLRTELQNYANGQDTTLKSNITQETDAKIVDTKNEFSRQFTETNTKIEGITIGGRNLILGSKTEYPKPAREFLQTIDLAPIFEKYPLTQKYSLSIDIKSPIAGSIQVYMQNGSGTKYNFVNQGVQVTTEWQRFKFEGLSPTLSKTAETKAILAFYGGYDSGVFPLVRNIKLELGTKATDYTVAPEDIDNQLSGVNVRIEKVEGGLTATNERFSTVYTKTETDTVLNDKFSPIQSQVNTQQSSINQLSSEITQKVSKTDYTVDQNNIVQRLNGADSERQQLSNQISDRVTINTYNSGIQDTKNYTDTTVSSIEIGTRNLLRNSNFNTKDLSRWNINGTVAYTEIDSYKTAKITNVTSAGLYQLPTLTENGVIYSVSFMAKAVGTTSKVQIGYLGQGTGCYKVFDVDNTWKKYSFTMTKAFNKSVNNNFHVYSTTTSNEGFYITEIKLEKGNKVTDYTVAPEDTETRLSVAETSISQNGEQIALRATKAEFDKANKTLSQATTDLIVNAFDGVTMTHNADGTLSSATIGDTIRLKSNRIDLVGDVYMQDGQVRVTNLKIGGTDRNGAIEIKNANDEVFFGLDTEQATASELSIGTLKVENIMNPNIVNQSSEDLTFYVMGTGSNENDGLTANTPFETVGRALEEIPSVYNGVCNIYMYQVGGGELIEVKGFSGKGRINFLGCYSGGTPATAPVSNSVSFKIAGNSIDIYINYLKINTSSGVVGVDVDGSTVNLNNTDINGQNGSENAVRVSRNSYFEWRTGKSTNVDRGMTCQSGSRAFLREVTLYSKTYGIVAAYASQVECNTVSIKSGTSTNAFTGSFINGSITNLSTASTEPVAPTVTTKTVTLTSTSSGHYYHDNGYGWNGTFMSKYPIQGNWSGYGKRSGYWFFGNQFDQFNGKTIKKVRVYISRSSVNMQGYTGARKFTLRMHGYATKPSTAPAVSPSSSVYTNTLEFGQGKWVDVTSVYGSMMASSSWKGFAVRTESTSQYEYMALGTTLKVEVTYNV